MRFIILPGNGCNDIFNSNWYGWLAQELVSRNLEVVMENMPDPWVASEKNWIPFIHEVLKVDENTVLIGHSSGACCILRLLEQQKVLGAIIVSAAHTDLGDENERASGYFNRPWDWAAIRRNAGIFLHQFHSDDDYLVPVHEGRFIAEKLRAVTDEIEFSTLSTYANFTYEELSGRSHFFEPFPEILRVVDEKLVRS